MNEGIERLSPNVLAIDSTTGRLYIGLRSNISGSGVYVRNLVTNVKSDESVKYYLLRQSYPNPFNSMATISYTLPRPEHVRLKVCDILGREISILINAYQEPGEHHVVFDGSHIASGVYVYRIQAGTWSEARKLLLIR